MNVLILVGADQHEYSRLSGPQAKDTRHLGKVIRDLVGSECPIEMFVANTRSAQLTAAELDRTLNAAESWIAEELCAESPEAVSEAVAWLTIEAKNFPCVLLVLDQEAVRINGERYAYWLLHKLIPPSRLKKATTIALNLEDNRFSIF